MRPLLIGSFFAIGALGWCYHADHRELAQAKKEVIELEAARARGVDLCIKDIVAAKDIIKKAAESCDKKMEDMRWEVAGAKADMNGVLGDLESCREDLAAKAKKPRRGKKR